MKIIDDFLWKDDHKFFVDLFENKDFPWFICKKVAAQEVPEEYERQWYMTHMFYDNTICSDYYGSIEEKILRHKDFPTVFAMLRIKGNMYPGAEKLSEHAPHSDTNFTHMGAIYYINTNNGYTLIEGQKVESIANRMVIFDPSIPHNSTDCTDEPYRMNINFNFFGATT
tara:strand:+ start:66 stop:572 length:507 start_codon:yes stop_codon:yes gene_type:complete